MVRFFPFFVKLSILLSFFAFQQAYATTTKNTWYGGFTLLSLKSDYIKGEDIERDHDRSFGKRSVGGNSYGQQVLDFDDATTGYRYFIGVYPNDSWEFELAFIDFGETHATFIAGDINGPFDRSYLEASATVKGIASHVQYRHPIEGYEGFHWLVRLGIMAWDGQVQERFYTDNDSINVRSSVSNNRGYDEYFGVGVNYKIDDRWRTRLDADRYVVGSAEIDAISLTLDYRFDWSLF